MPPPATPRAANRGGNAKSTPTKPLDIGVPLGVHDTNTVRARVRKWQQQGGGVITINDGTYDDDEENVKEEKPKPKPAKVKPDRVEKAFKDKEKTATAPAVRKRSHSTPRKRVISDEHWRRNRSTTTTQTGPRNLPIPKRINEYTTNEGTGSPRTARKDYKTDDPDRGRDRPRSKARRDTTTAKSPTRDGKRSSTRKDTESVADSDAETDPPRSTVMSDIPERQRRQSPPPEDVEWAKSEADFTELSRRRARGPAKPPKGGIFAHMLDESRKMFTRPEAEPSRPAPPPTGNRGAKIEAWLSGTSDPFVEGSETKSDMPGPLDIKSARARRSQKITDEIASSVLSRSELSVESDSRPKSSHSRHSSKDKDRPSSSEKPRKSQERDASSNSKRSNIDKVERPLALRIREDRKIDKPYEDSLAPSESEIQPFSEGSEVSANNAPVPTGPKRPFPGTGNHRLSTIASSDTLSTVPEGSPAPAKEASTEKPIPKTIEEEEEAAEDQDKFDPDSLPQVTSQLKRRLTTHNDLMSVLSGPGRSRSTRSNRSIRSNKSRLANATIADIMAELSADETKYMRELKTIVGGVIPVLLTCVLSRSDSAIAAGLFRPSMDPKDDVNFSKPIVNMGVAIERLKTLHKRIPQDNADALLTWAQGAQRVYREYLKAWRLGFKDVIVNLAPLEEDEANQEAETKSLDEGLERDENGDVIGSDGEKVDVAYLLKRPLVRLKYLHKTFKGINTLQPSTKADEIAAAYQDLVTDARKRARDERARLEDESASNIDPSRARDPMTLGVLQDIKVDHSRRVRARDFFNLSLYHSSGQLVDCRAELLYRDNTPSNGPGGDLMICEIDHSDRWLLFPPMDLRCVSARSGDSKGEIVLMLRSAPDAERYWQELISLRIDEVEVGLEWIQLLGSDPIPPTIFRTQSFISRAKQHKARKSDIESPPRTNPSDVDIPIGEKPSSKRRSLTSKEHYSEPSTVDSYVSENRSSVYSAGIREETDYTTGGSELSAKPSRPGLPLLPSTVSPDKSSSGLKRSKAKRMSRYGDSPSSETPTSSIGVPDNTLSSPTTQAQPQPPPQPQSQPELQPTTPQQPETRFYGGGKDSSKDSRLPKPKSPPKIPQTPRERESPEESPRVSSVPSAHLPQIPKLRSASSQTHMSSPTNLDVDEEEDYPPLESLPDREEELETPTKQRRKSRRKSKHEDKHDDGPPLPPPHRSPSSKPSSNQHILSPSAVKLKRRGSSPLKHEYEPSTASDYSETDSDASTVRHYSYSSSDYSRSDSESESDYSSESEDEESELPKPRIHDTATATSETSSLSPSNSASQSGYRTVPVQPAKSSKVVASLFGWSDKGSWDSLTPDECDIVVSPGLIEAFKMTPDSNSNSSDRSSRSSRPLISMELTPLVPLRRGTAIDISIRSPPTDRSKITSSNNIMFRSRNPDECDSLYGLINQARINNPTYIALQNARGGTFDNPIPTYEPDSKSGGSWFGFPRRRKSYRASGSPRSLAEGSESSVGTMSSAFSALKRFGAGNKMFNISRSTVTSRSGREGSMYSGSGESASNHSPSSGIGRIAAAIKGADGIGLSNAKIRIYLRETASKWRDMGAARLTIMPAPPKNPSRPGTAVSSRSEGSGTHGDGSGPGSSPPSSGAATPRRDVETEKRIIIRGKTRGEVLLDVCLPESSFERIARTGIAVSVHEETAGGAVAQKGGVTASSQRIYMIQMKSEAEAAYTFGLVGKLRY